MRKIRSHKVTVMYFSLSLIFAAIVLAIGEPKGFLASALYILVFTLSGCFLMLPFAMPNYIIFDFASGRVDVLNIPVLSTNKTRKLYGSLIDYNNVVFLDEVDHVEIVRLSSAEKRAYVGHRHIFSRYLKLYMKYSASQKYIYISIYSKSQVRKIIKFLTAP